MSHQDPTEQGNDPQSQDSVELKGPAGLAASLKGKNLTSYLVVVVAAFFLFYIIQTRDSKNMEMLNSIDAGQKRVEAILKEQQALNEAFIYVLTLTPEQREKLNLQRPASLERMRR